MTSIPESSHEQLDADLKALKAATSKWLEVSLAQRIEILKTLSEGVAKVEAKWVQEACAAKKLDLNKPQAGEEWLAGPLVMQRFLRLLRETLEAIAQHGAPQLPKNSVSKAGNGQTVVRVFPANLYDKLLFQGFTADVWMEPEVSKDNLKSHMAKIYQGQPGSGAVSLVLGAGNVSSIGPLDVLTKLFAENEVCLLKMNPVNEYLGPIFAEAFQSLIDDDYMKIAYGGAKVGAYLCQHEDVDTIHITGSDKTHDIIVWGPPGDERERRKKDNDPVNTKPITSELGNVSPVVVVPGPWTTKDIEFHVQNIATMLCNNASFNCNAAKLLILPKDWSLKEAFVTALESCLRAVPQRFAYYPGAEQRYGQFTEAYESKPLGERTDTVIPWTMLAEVDSSSDDELCFHTEAFCSVLAQTSLEGGDDTPAEFLERAVAFCNDRVWGTLNCSVFIHPKTEKQAKVKSALDKAIEDLRYGTIVVNHWPGLGYGLCCTPWGAYPGHSLDDIQSGRGFVHNTYLFEKPQKTLIRGPFIVSPRPPWFVTNKNTHSIGPKLSRFEKSPSLFGVPGIAVSALFG